MGLEKEIKKVLVHLKPHQITQVLATWKAIRDSGANEELVFRLARNLHNQNETEDILHELRGQKDSSSEYLPD